MEVKRSYFMHLCLMDRDIEFIRKIGEIGMMKTEEALAMIGGHVDEELFISTTSLSTKMRLIPP